MIGSVTDIMGGTAARDKIPDLFYFRVDIASGGKVYGCLGWIGSTKNQYSPIQSALYYRKGEEFKLLESGKSLNEGSFKNYDERFHDAVNFEATLNAPVPQAAPEIAASSSKQNPPPESNNPSPKKQKTDHPPNNPSLLSGAAAGPHRHLPPSHTSPSDPNKQTIGPPKNKLPGGSNLRDLLQFKRR